MYVCSDRQILRPNDRTLCAQGSDKNCVKEMFLGGLSKVSLVGGVNVLEFSNVLSMLLKREQILSINLFRIIP